MGTLAVDPTDFKVPSGYDWVSGSAGTGQCLNELKGGDPRTDKVTQGADSELPGLATQRERDPTATKKEVHTNQRGLHQRTKWSKGQEPWRRGATGFCKLSRQLLDRRLAMGAIATFAMVFLTAPEGEDY